MRVAARSGAPYPIAESDVALFYVMPYSTLQISLGLSAYQFVCALIAYAPPDSDRDSSYRFEVRMLVVSLQLPATAKPACYFSIEYKNESIAQKDSNINGPFYALKPLSHSLGIKKFDQAVAAVDPVFDGVEKQVGLLEEVGSS